MSRKYKFRNPDGLYFVSFATVNKLLFCRHKLRFAKLAPIGGQMGEDKFIYSLGTISKEQKRQIEEYISIGLEYGNNPNFQNKTIQEVFPKIYTSLKSKSKKRLTF
ncbi:MAG: hypothetical protein LBR81_07540 [Prevotellaceae bacterium]|jgi:hypothetical protein|nr:hypothetical protein [Prevotellaceae bacterium]